MLWDGEELKGIQGISRGPECEENVKERAGEVMMGRVLVENG
jgi:hypothetical protein